MTDDLPGRPDPEQVRPGETRQDQAPRRRPASPLGGWHYEPGPAGMSLDTISAARAVREGVVRLARRMQAQRQEHGVGPTGMAILSRINRDGVASPSALAEAEGTQPQSLTRVIASLEEKGLITRYPDPNDGRGVLLELTEDGVHTLHHHAETHVAWLAEAMSAELTLVEQRVLQVAAELLDRLADHR